MDATAGKPLAIIVDLDETLCTQFDVPVAAGLAVLRRIDQHKIRVHYVTARTEQCRPATDVFVDVNGLPGRHNIHYCPISLTSLEHKRSQHQWLSQEFQVIASIGDSFEEQQASLATGILFVPVDPCEPAHGWAVLAGRIAELGGFRP